MLSPTQMLSIKVQTKNRPVHMHMRVFFSTGLSAPLVQRFTDTNMSRHRHTSRPEPIAWPLMRTTEFTGPLNIRPKRTRFQKLAGNHILSRQCHGPIPHRTTPRGHMSPSHVLETGYLRTSRSCTWHGLRNCHTPHGSCALHTTPTRHQRNCSMMCFPIMTTTEVILPRSSSQPGLPCAPTCVTKRSTTPDVDITTENVQFCSTSTVVVQ